MTLRRWRWKRESPELRKSQHHAKSHLPIVPWRPSGPPKKEPLPSSVDIPRTIYPPRPNDGGTSPAAERQWEEAFYQANPHLTRLVEAIARREAERSKRCTKLVWRLLAICRAYACEPGEWRPLAIRIASNFGLLNSIVPLARNDLDAGKLSLDFWRYWALSLVIRVNHVRVAPFNPGAETRKSDQHLEIDLRLGAMLTPDPQTRLRSCRSIAQAMRAVRQEMAAEAAEIREATGYPHPDPPAARSMEKDYHRRERSRRVPGPAKHALSQALRVVRIPYHFERRMYDVQVFDDIEQAAAAVERRRKTAEQIW